MYRCWLIIAVIVLYAVPFYRGGLQPGEHVYAAVEENGSVGEIDPVYAEHFVNNELPGLISHVSSITSAGPGKMACVWYSGSKEGAPDVSIYLSIYNEEESTWSTPSVVVSRVQASGELGRYIKKLGNAVISNDNSGRLWLFYASVTVGGWSGTTINYTVSHDQGETWAKSRKMVLSPFLNLTNNVKNKPLLLDDGSLLLPVYHEFLRKFSQLVHFRPDKNGAQYEIRKMTMEGRAIQPSIINEGKAGLTAFFRNMGHEEKNHILRADSSDLGLTWTGLSDTPLPNPNSGFDMLRLESGSYIGIINNSYKDRENLSLVLSDDRGKSWRLLKVLEESEGNEYSYPSIIRSRQGLYHITYTYERRRIKHVVFNETWLKNNMGGTDQRIF